MWRFSPLSLLCAAVRSDIGYCPAVVVSGSQQASRQLQSLLATLHHLLPVALTQPTTSQIRLLTSYNLDESYQRIVV